MAHGFDIDAGDPGDEQPITRAQPDWPDIVPEGMLKVGVHGPDQLDYSATSEWPKGNKVLKPCKGLLQEIVDAKNARREPAKLTPLSELSATLGEIEGLHAVLEGVQADKDHLRDREQALLGQLYDLHERADELLDKVKAAAPLGTRWAKEALEP